MEFFTDIRLLVGLITALVSFAVWRLSKSHQETLAAINHAYSKEAHAANHLYTQKASHLEKAGEIVGDLKFWAEKCVVPRTRTDFGSKEEIASKMSKCFEDLSNHVMRYPFTFDGIPKFYENLGSLMGCVNFIENMVNAGDFKSDSKEWKESVTRFQNELAPLTQSLQNEINALIHQI